MATFNISLFGGDALAHSSTSNTALHYRPRIQWSTALCLVLSLASSALATRTTIDELPEPTRAPDLAQALLLDTHIPVLDQGKWTMMEPAENELRRRATAGGSVTTTFEITISPSATATSTTSSSPLPSPFDGGISSNFTSTSCPTFFESMLADPELQACYPVSMMLQSSQSFFEAEKSLVSISTVLDHACEANVTRCTDYLARVARNLTDSSNCGADYQAGNPTVTEAYLGLTSYQVVYSATCLKDPKTAVYCFGNAVTNQTNPTETYFYYLPLNSTLPGGTVPICASCLQDTMDIYQVATANRRQPIANTYDSAAEQVNTLCGPNFANTTMPEAIVSSAGFSALVRGPSWVLSSSILIMAISWLL
ncbi:hypothetical protein J7T55_009621 [Diaporthe amygdali]|uniref:uncharacterized protein n=1 Tax=Phomopsis amygdali TaxID=1214568 RepID=UPI0022FE1D18|nr:uncharacterized protein J7T55_009621 [Diaporthe amygdali]KAJ0109289.1 hypothetical protein J7T55_009621 [Diaporthe amygdali]